MATRARLYRASTSPAGSPAAWARSISASLIRTTASVSPRRKAERTFSLKVMAFSPSRFARSRRNMVQVSTSAKPIDS